VKYACIQANQHEFDIILMCRVLSVCRSGFYAWKRQRLGLRAQSDQQLRLHVRLVHQESSGRYGSPRIQKALKARGISTSRKRVERLMREQSLRGRQRRQFRVTTDSNHEYPVATNVLSRRFAPDLNTDTDRVWVADLTYIPTREGWLYLAVVLDLASRFVVGWSMSKSLSSTIASDALDMAVQRRRPRPGLLHHSDRGVQYASAEYRALLSTHGIAVSMSRKGDCWDNAVAESFFATLERELIDDADWSTRAQAASALFQFIEVWYNRNRIHSSLGYLTPEAYEQQLHIKRIAA
jgi:putative transposase